MSNAKVLRRLDTALISEDLAEHLLTVEGAVEYIDDDYPRNVEWTSEIMSPGVTRGFVVVDADGNKLASAKSSAAAHKIADSAKVTVSVAVEEPEEEEEPVVDLTPDDEDEDALPS